MHIAVNGVALNELRCGLRGSEHILVGGEVFERSSVDHSGGGTDVSHPSFLKNKNQNIPGSKIKISVDAMPSSVVMVPFAFRAYASLRA